MLPILPLLQFLRINWKPIAVGLGILALSAMIVGGCRHYRGIVASNAVLQAENKQAQASLDRWKAAEAERTRREAEAARVADEARREARLLDEAFAHTKAPADLVARGDVARLFGVLAESTAVDP